MDSGEEAQTESPVTEVRAGERNKQGRDDSWSATESNCSLTLSLRGKGKNIIAGTPVGSVDRERDSHWQNRDTKTKRRKKYPEFSLFPCSGLLKLPFSHGPTQLQVICPGDTGDAEMSAQSGAGKGGKWIWGPIQEKPAPQILPSPNTIIFLLTVTQSQ